MASDVTRYALVPVEMLDILQGLRLRTEDICRLIEIAASPGQGAVTAAQLEAAAIAIYEEMEAEGLLRGEDEFPPWAEAPQDVAFLVRKLAKAAFTCPALGLQVSS